MKGVSDLSERPGFFRPIVDAMPGGMARVYAAAEALFVQLADELKKYQVRWKGKADCENSFMAGFGF
jgi:dynein heavy chain 2